MNLCSRWRRRMAAGKNGATLVLLVQLTAASAMAEESVPAQDNHQRQHQEQQHRREQEQRYRTATDTSETEASALAEARTAFEKALLALEQQQWGQAELLLERTLMFQPEHAEALLQLAILLAQRDRLESAQALIAMLLQDPRTPPGHRLQLQALLDNTSQQQSSAVALGSAALSALPPAPVARTEMLWSAGYTRNLLGITSAAQLTLTLPSGPVVLPLAVQSQAAMVGTVALHHQAANGLELYAQTQQTTLSQARSTSRLALAGPLGLKNHNWSLSTLRALDGSTRHSAGVVRTLQGNAQLMASVFYESSYKRIDWLVRSQRSTTIASRWPLTVWGEYEHGRGSAPGAVRAGLQSMVALDAQWQLQGLVHGQWDTSGYSRLLENNAARRMITTHLELEHRWPSPQFEGQLTLSAYASRRWSNLALFAWNDSGLRLSWLRRW